MQAFSAHVARFFKLRSTVSYPDAKRQRTNDANDLMSIFDIDWLVQATDEIHETRGSQNRVFIGICQLRAHNKVRFSIGITATPILNNPRVSALHMHAVHCAHLSPDALCHLGYSKYRSHAGNCWPWRRGWQGTGTVLQPAGFASAQAHHCRHEE